MTAAKLFFVVPLILILSAAIGNAQAGNLSVQNLDISFEIKPDLSVTQTMKFSFSSELTEKSTNYTIGNKIKNIIANDGEEKLEYRLLQKGDSYDLQISLVKPTKNLTVSYAIDGVVFRSDSVGHFFTEFAFEKTIERMNVHVKLPEGYAIYQNSYKPASAKTTSDGRSIILVWEFQNVKEPVLFSVKFANARQSSNIWLAIAIVLAGGIVALYAYSRRKAKEEFVKGFRTDEQKVIQYLENRKKATQNEIKKEFQFSRAKATRIVMKLEEKKLIEKQKLGRTNKLIWIKKKGLL